MFYYLFDRVNQKTKYGSIPDSNAAAAASSSSSTNANNPVIPDNNHSSTNSTTVKISIDDAIDMIGISWSGLQGRLFIVIALLFTVDSMELAVLAFLSKTMDQQIESYHDNDIAWAGFGGSLVGALVLGSLADHPRVGRRGITVVVSCLVTLFGMVTALLCTVQTQNFVVEGLLISRFLVGFALGGVTVPYDLLAEWLPNHIHLRYPPTIYTNPTPIEFYPPLLSLRRGQVLLLVHLFWSAGNLLVFGLLQTHTRLSPQQGSLTGIELWWCTLPAILATLVLICSPSVILESPRFLLSQGRRDEALALLKQAAIANGKDPQQLFPSSFADDEGVASTTTIVRLYSNEAQAQSYPLHPQQTRQTFSKDNLFSLKWLKLASALLFTYIGQNFCYQSTANMLVSTFNEDEHPQQWQALLSALSEGVGIFLLIMTIEVWGRIPTQVSAYALASLASLTLAVWYAMPYLQNGNVLIILTLMARMLVFGGGCTTWVSTTEVLRTEIRTTGHAVAAGMAGRLGAFVATLALYDIESIPTLALIVFFGSFAIALAAGDIPETRRQEMGRSYNLLGYSERWGARM